MRLRRLELTRYGRFTDRTIDFGAHAAGTPDLHVVYGANEAGKSTALAGFLDLLFGIEMRSRYGFRHSYETMRVGAALEIGGAVHELARIKRPQRSLLDGAGQPVGDGVLLGALGGLDRAGYRAMFSLDDETLEAGGESILASRGDAGQLLFAASAGLAELGQALAGLKEEADGFHRRYGHGGELRRMKAELAALKERREAIDMGAPEHARLEQEREQAAVQHQAAVARRAGVQLRIEETRHRLQALPRFASLLADRAAVAALAATPDAPAGWREAVRTLREEEIDLLAKAHAAEAEVARQEAALAGIVVDVEACGLAPRWAPLGARIDRHVKAALDLPKLAGELADGEARIAAVLARIGRAGAADPARLLIDAPRRAALEALILSQPAVAASAQAAQDEHSAALMRFAAARAALDAAGAGIEVAGLGEAVAAVRQSDHAPRRRAAERAAAAAQARLAAHMQALLPWRGEAAVLGGLAVPDPGHVAGWKSGLAEAAAEAARLERELARVDAEAARQRAERAAIGAATGAVTDAEAAALRAAREAAWSAHRARLDAGSAEAFEAALRRDDAATAGMLRHAQEVARLHEADIALARLLAERDAAAGQLGVAVARRDGIAAAVAAAASGLGLPADTTPVRLEAWMAARAEALRALSELGQAEREAADAAADEAAACAALSGALAAAGVAHDAGAGFAALLATALAALEQAGAVKALRARVEASERDLAERSHALQRAGEADRRWSIAWAEACAATWLGEGGEVPPPQGVREVLAALGGLDAALEAQAGLARRIAEMRTDEAAFGQEVRAVAAPLGIEAGGLAVPELAQCVAGRMAAALAARDARDAAAAALEETRARGRAVAAGLAMLAARKAEMTAHFGVADLAGVAARLEEAERRRELLARIAEAERDILAMVRLPELAEAEAALAAADRAALEREAAELAPQFDAADRDMQELHARRRAAEDRLAAVGGGDEAARLDAERRAMLEEIEERARRHLKLRVGIAATEQALRAYRDRHRSGMMERASAAFRTISRGAYARLATRPEKDGEVLIAVGADSGAKLAAELSKGTRFQLYLALRVAGYHEFATTRPPVPFIADDIMETFDDDRSEEAFRLLGGMAMSGQVVYLTHHRHLCDVARRLFPEMRVHELA